MASNFVRSSGVLTLNIDDLRTLFEPAEIDCLEQMKQEETRLKSDREVIQKKLNQLLRRINDLDEEVEREEITELEFQSMNAVRIFLNLRHQQLAERLVRVGTQLARTKIELKRREVAIYKDVKARGLI
ncbi:uncharacterized protein LOC119554039 [Drosophila subpulchrella]|uniref:uncharacterized protein LOC119554039 n=1 Tax=Drosophila subpulchrella TaxID=1486046 RepID=UPI0018A17243|nr:uncharacterized protein LOC119554039 [Drosophila subpulchrella]